MEHYRFRMPNKSERSTEKNKRIIRNLHIRVDMAEQQVQLVEESESSLNEKLSDAVFQCLVDRYCRSTRIYELEMSLKNIFSNKLSIEFEIIEVI